MMNFNKANQPAKTLVLHYAKQLRSEIAESVVSGNSNLGSKEEAKSLAYFFWEMTDQAVDDQKECKMVEGITDIQSWLEKALHIFRGYFKK
ncbi:hypothetical protein BTJ40_14850 [Microbulbifer sp. A4B17]|uniref:hypothetical protein n=1 Tax=Microbulbifer sp. A4B17 TaxID=359370 RepID=UPI000D52B214|nr:hypothetical protein [Microbulbifer sp. A4B17]AWF82002.1 hypothetical protein BTJ40_14850 [Microbulbifer sp. A4B17]